MLKFFVNVSTFLFGQPVRNQEKLIHRLKTRDEDSFRLGFQKIDAKSLRESMAIGPADHYRGLESPIFLLGAEKDVQCDPRDCYRIAELLEDNASVHVESDLTHILRKDPCPPSFYAYLNQLIHPPDPVVAELIIGWLRKSGANQVDRPP
jgi:hypothetical protein